jgi:hypothetical protein
VSQYENNIILPKPMATVQLVQHEISLIFTVRPFIYILTKCGTTASLEMIHGTSFDTWILNFPNINAPVDGDIISVITILQDLVDYVLDQDPCSLLIFPSSYTNPHEILSIICDVNPIREKIVLKMMPRQN